MEWKLLRILGLFWVGAVTSPATPSSTLEALRQKVAGTFFYPPAKLTIREGPLTEIHNGAQRGVILNVHLASTDHSFHPMQIAVGRKDSVFSPSERAEFEAAVEAGTTKNGKPTKLKIAKAENGAVVYSGWGLPGPDGGVAMIWILFPDRDAGVVMSWTTSRENPVDLANAPEKYREMFSSEFPESESFSALSKLAHDAVGLTLPSQTAAPHGPAAPNASAVEIGTDSTTKNSGQNSTHRQPAEFPAAWPWLLVGLILAALLVVAVRQRRR